MKLLLDTRVWLWLQVAPERIAGETLETLGEPQHELFLSAASAWEIAIKCHTGKLALPLPPAEYVPSRMARSGTEPLAVLHVHALRVAELPPHHRDPFDRLLVAQAQHESMTLVSNDHALARYDVPILWA